MFTETIIRDLRKIQIAQDAVRPVVGDVGDCDSPGVVYRRALQRLGHDVRGITGTAAAAMWPVLRNQDRRSRIAMDAKTQTDMAARFPGATKLKQR